MGLASQRRRCSRRLQERSDVEFSGQAGCMPCYFGRVYPPVPGTPQCVLTCLLFLGGGDSRISFFGIKRGKWLWTYVDQAKHWTQVLTTYDWQITQHHVAIVPCDVTRIVLVGWSGSPAVAGNLTPGLTPSPAAGVARWYGLCVWIVVAESGSIYVLNMQWSELSWCCFRDWM